MFLGPKKTATNKTLQRYGGEGVEIFLGEDYEEYDPNSPTDMLVDADEVTQYEFNFTAIKKWLPWVVV